MSADPFLPPVARLRVFWNRGDRYVTLCAGPCVEATTLHPADVRRTWWRLAARCWQAHRMAEARSRAAELEGVR